MCERVEHRPQRAILAKPLLPDRAPGRWRFDRELGLVGEVFGERGLLVLLQRVQQELEGRVAVTHSACAEVGVEVFEVGRVERELPVIECVCLGGDKCALEDLAVLVLRGVDDHVLHRVIARDRVPRGRLERRWCGLPEEVFVEQVVLAAKRRGKVDVGCRERLDGARRIDGLSGEGSPAELLEALGQRRRIDGVWRGRLVPRGLVREIARRGFARRGVGFASSTGHRGEAEGEQDRSELPRRFLSDECALRHGDPP